MNIKPVRCHSNVETSGITQASASIIPHILLDLMLIE